MLKIPAQGLSRDEVFARMETYTEGDLRWKGGKAFSYVYDAGEEIEAVSNEAMVRFAGTNLLYPNAFGSLLRFENELVSMMASHLRGPETAVGTFTSGGTESNTLAIKTARYRFRERNPNAGVPEIIMPITVHASVQKAAHLMGMKSVVVPIDPKTYKADVSLIQAAINSNTCMIVASAPQYAHGVIDPIVDLGQLALQHDIWLHVDSCIGGFLLPYFRRLGANVPDFDLSVPGVHSISVDLHKYGYTAKGASVVIYRDKELRQHQFYACANWARYTLINNTLQSTKSGCPLAAAWAVLNHIGDAGYLELARTMLQGTQQLREGLDALDDIYIMGDPQMNLIPIASDTIDIFELIDEMNSRGWTVQTQLGFQQGKENMHLAVGPKVVPHIPALLRDLQACIAIAKEKGPNPMLAGLRDMLSTLNPDDFTPDMLGQMLGMAGLQGVELPKRMATINNLLNLLPTTMREKLLLAFANELYAL